MLRAILPIVICILCFTACQSGNSNDSSATSSQDSGKQQDVSGKEVYQQYCKNCHGADGTMELNNAANLATSEMTEEEMRNIIRNGKKMMMAYKNVLSEKEIDAVIKYTKTLRN